MESGSLFSEKPLTPEAIIAQVRQQLSADYPEDLVAWPGVLDQNVETVVRDLWQGRVKTFVPVLALREARDLLRDRDNPLLAFQPAVERSLPERRVGEAQRDAMSLDGDVMSLDASDVLRL